MPEVRIENDVQAAQLLDESLGRFVDLLEHVARFNPKAIRLGFDLEVDQAISDVWFRLDLPQL